MYVRITPAFLDDSFDVRKTQYFKTDHYSLLYGRDSFHLRLDVPLHWRLDCFAKTKDGEYVSEGYTNVLMLDFDQERDDRKVITHEQAEDLRKRLGEFLDIPFGNFCYSNTGFGVHFYLFFDNYYQPTRHKWLKEFAKKIKEEFDAGYGLSLDLGSVANKRTIRLPKSVYMKKGEGGHMTSLVLGNKKLVDFLKFHEKWSYLYTEKPVKKEETNLKNIQDWKKIEWQSIIGTPGDEYSGCRFLRWSLMAQMTGEVNYQEWMAQLTLTSRMVKDKASAYSFAKQFSDQDSRFDEKVYEEKFNEARDNMYPATCEHIQNIWKLSKDPNIGCATCPHRQLNMPLNISTYPNKDKGFRILMTKKNKNGTESKTAGAIDYESFTSYLRKEEKIVAETDETLYKYIPEEKFYKEYKYNVLISDYKHLIIPQIKPSEIDQIKKFIKNSSVFDIENEFEKQKNLIFFRNGVLDTEKQVLMDYDPDKYKNTYCFDFDFDEKATATKYEEVLAFALDNITERNYFMQYIATALFTNNPHEKMMVLLGSGANGKTTLMRGVLSMFPFSSRYVSYFDLDSIKKDESYLGLLRRSKILYCSDVSPRMFQANNQIIKRLTSGENFSYRNKYAREVVSFVNKSKLIFSLNEMPYISEKTHGFSRRFSMIDFKNTIPLENQDVDIHKKLEAEKAGIFNLFFNALIEYRKKNAFPELDGSVFKNALYKGNNIEAFMSEHIQVDAESEIYFDEIYKKYREYCMDSGDDNYVNRRELSHAIVKAFSKETKRIRRTSSRGLQGIRYIQNKPEVANGQTYS